MRFIRRNESGYYLDEYFAYLRDHGDRFPPGGRAFALADWHYDISHRQCPHDSWLEYFSVKEISSGQRNQIRSTELTAHFLGASHDGHFDLVYHGVSSYGLELAARATGDAIRGHGDWLIDELTLSVSNTIIHDIEFSAARWTVSCVDLRYSWTPISP